MVLSSRLLFAKSEEEDSTVRHHVEVTQLRNVIMRSLSELRQSQHVLMPGLGPILNAMGDDETAEVSFKLLLPSELSVEDRRAWCLPDVPALEFWFRYAQADDSLAEVRHLLRLFQNLRSQNSKHLGFAQRALTRTRGLFDSLRTKIHCSSGCYSCARNAMLALDLDEKFNPGWTKRFQMLNEGDACGPGREADNTSEGQFTPSWIWLVPRLGQHPPSPQHPPPSMSLVQGTSQSRSIQCVFTGQNARLGQSDTKRRSNSPLRKWVARFAIFSGSKVGGFLSNLNERNRTLLLRLAFNVDCKHTLTVRQTFMPLWSFCSLTSGGRR